MIMHFALKCILGVVLTKSFREERDIRRAPYGGRKEGDRERYIYCRSLTFECMEGSCSDLFLIMPFTHIVALTKCSGVAIKPLI